MGDRARYTFLMRIRFAPALLICSLAAACGGPKKAQAPAQAAGDARNLMIITIDTLRADRLGVNGYGAARTPAIDALARGGVNFTRAYATTPITLPSHASLMTGRYPAGHGARHNGMRLDLETPTLAASLSQAGFSTGGFVAAFPLDRRFGLIKGFQTYGDRLPHVSGGPAINERPGRLVVDEALAWLDRHRTDRFFLWVHLFEPHTPYGNVADPAERRRPAALRYDDEVAEADAQVGRVVQALGAQRDSTLIVVAADHGESFGEHGESGHSLFVYDTTLRIPLIIAGPGVPQGRTVSDPAAIIDVAPTVMGLLGAGTFDADGVDLRGALTGAPLPARDLYAESFAPLLDFGWSPLRSVRSSALKYIDAPRAELYDTAKDPGELTNIISAHLPRASALQEIARRHPGPEAATPSGNDPEARARLQALGYASGSAPDGPRGRTDPKDRLALASRLALVASGELEGPVLEATLRRILEEDPANPQGNVRLGFVLLDSNRCAEATRRFRSAVAAHLPSADAHLGLAACERAQQKFGAAAATLRDAERVEPDNPIVVANLGLVLSDGGRPADAIGPLQRALTLDPDLHQARFSLALAFARTGRRADALGAARELLHRLPPDAPQRPEVQRLIARLE